MYSNSSDSTLPIILTGRRGAVGRVVEFTEGCRTGPIFRPAFCRTGNERSSIIRPRRLSCGTRATGEIFRFGGLRERSSVNGTTSENPAATWYAMSSSKTCMASGVRAERCGPRWMATLMLSADQSGPQSTVTPCFHSSRTGPKRGVRVVEEIGTYWRRFQQGYPAAGLPILLVACQWHWPSS